MGSTPEVGTSRSTRHADDTPARCREALRGAVDTRVERLLLVAHEAHAADHGATPDWCGLALDHARDEAAELRRLLDGLYRRADAGDWSLDEVASILLEEVLGHVVPLSVSRGEDVVYLRLARPEGIVDGGVGLAGWPHQVVAVLRLAGEAVHPGFTIAPLEDDAPLPANADPPEVQAVVTLTGAR